MLWYLSHHGYSTAFFYLDHSTSKLQLESPLEQLTLRGKFIIERSVLRMSAFLTVCYGNLCCARRPHG